MTLSIRLSDRYTRWLNGEEGGSPFAAYARYVKVGDRLNQLADLGSIVAGKGAALIGLVDALALYTAINVEDALAEVRTTTKLKAATELTIASDTVAVTQSEHTIDTAADAATDDLVTLTGGATGMVVKIRPSNAARNIVLVHSIVANGIATPGGQNITLKALTDYAELHHNGTQWTVISSSRLADDGQTLVAVGTILTAAVRTMNATPVSMIAAPGAGKYLDVQSIHWFLDFATVAYDAAASGDTLEAKYTNSSGAAVCDAVAGNAIGAAAADYHALVRAVPEVIPVANAALVAHINAGEWYAAGGDSPLLYEVHYKVRSLAFA